MFNVGFEFELYYPMSYAHENRRDPYDFVLKDYKDWFERSPWLNNVTCVYEGSLLINRQIDRKNYFGCEIVTPPLPIADAKDLLRETFNWMKDRGCKTLKECGFHINISFTDDRKTKKVNYISLMSNVPQEKILKQFKRSNSNYCRHTDSMKISLIDLFDSWSCTNPVMCKDYTLDSILNLLDNPAELINVLRTEINLKAYDLADDNYKEISIVPKSNGRTKYYEFRMTGNKNYHLRHDEISRVLDTYTKAMKASL